jgi:excisionase family DNA binding protein
VALELADEYAGLDIERVVNVLARTLSDMHGRPLTKWPKVKRSEDSRLGLLPHVWFFPDIGEALQYLSQEEALALFERGDLDLLRARQLYAAFMGSRDAPLYTVRQCANQINGLLKHQQKDRQSMVETGYPRTAFKYSVILTQQMVELYPVRWPSEVKEEDGEYLYTWSSARWQDDDQPCSYEEAPLVPGLSVQDAARLEYLRGRFFDSRAEVLRTLVLCLREDDPEALWRDSKAALIKYLSADEAYFLMEIDNSQKSSEYAQPKSLLSAKGGLSGLLSLVGYCEKELRIGTMAKACGALGELIRKDERGRPYLIFGSYYEVLGKPEQQKIESSCDMLAELEGQEKEFWGEYEQRVNIALDEEFEIDVTVTKRPKPGYDSDYKTVIETFGTAPLLTAEEVARILAVPKKTVMNLARAGDLPRHKIGTKTVRFSLTDVNEYMRRTRVVTEAGEETDAE